MSKIKLIIDSNCNLSDGLLEKWNLGFVPSLVTYDNKVFRDGIDIHANDIYKICDSSSVLPKTVALNIAQFQEYFQEFLKTNEKLIFISISSFLSGGNSNAHMAVKNLNAEDRILILDSENLACGIGILVERIVQDIEKGFDFKQIQADIDELKKRVNVEFVIDKLDNLYKGGRCSGLSFLVGKTLHIHPIIGLKDGKMNPIHKVRGVGTKKGAEVILTDLEEDIKKDNVDFSLPIYVTNADDVECHQMVLDKLKELVQDKTIVRDSNATSVIAVHCGKNTIGVGWVRKVNN